MWAGCWGLHLLALSYFFFLKRLFLDVKGGCIAWLMLVLCGDEKLVLCAGH